jgi:excisionase family DNA binding protein
VTEQVNLVDIDEVAKQLKVSVSTVRSWLRANLIPENTYIHVGKTYRFDLNRVVFALMHTDLNSAGVSVEDEETTEEVSEPVEAVGDLDEDL